MRERKPKEDGKKRKEREKKKGKRVGSSIFFSPNFCKFEDDP